MRISFKFRQLLLLSVLQEVLHRPHFRFKLRPKCSVSRISLRSWSEHGITIYKIYHWQLGKIWSSYYALFNSKRNRFMYKKAAVGYALTFDDLEFDLHSILWKYGDFTSFLDDMYNNDFSEDDIPQDLELDIPF